MLIRIWLENLKGSSNLGYLDVHRKVLKYILVKQLFGFGLE